ncbi:MMPL/RND family transporter [[Mycobacterium] nativiensis]|uniref:RND family transporter n=1 Tax=[Mycobacterium] nativiensis TaxID=2855503 RepID=A0ABU5XS36_9MYCO|nr:RND family transporter [Mycolicibacter sp. MYC340]MEB3030782.1 RND family transporter [Mycolicibacter sp. MYC340]
MKTHHPSRSRPSAPGLVRRFALPIILGWVAITLLVSLAVPALEQVAKEHPVSLSAKDAPSIQAMARLGHVFQESNTDSAAMIVIEGDEPLGESAHRYYNELIAQLNADTKHIQHIQDFWGDPLTAGGAQSADGKAALVQLNLAGNQGEALANDSVEAVRDIVNRTPAPPGVRAYVTGPAPMVTDMNTSGDRAVLKILLATVSVITLMLMLLYRSFSTVALLLAVVGIELAAARGIVAFLGHVGLIGLSTFAINILVTLAIAAGTDYGIFFIGRYHEARHAGEDPETAYYTTYRGVAHVVLASGLTIAGATLCLSFTRLPVFQTMGIPCAVGMLVAVAIALTLVPAVLTVASRYGLLEPRRKMSDRGWRKIGTAIVRWPGPIFVAASAVALIGLLALPGYQVSYKDPSFIPKDTPANLGWAAASRHFPESRLLPEVLLVEADRDMRNSADFLVLNKLAKSVFAVEGVALVQGVTRPEGAPLGHTSIPFLLSMQNAGQMQNLDFVKSRVTDMRKQADDLEGTIASLQRMYGLMQQMADNTHEATGVSHEAMDVAAEMRRHMADFNNSSKLLRESVSSQQDCRGDPTCLSLRSAYASMDSANLLTDKINELAPVMSNVDAVTPQLLDMMPAQIAAMRSLQTMMLTLNSTMSGIMAQAEEVGGDSAAMGQDFDAAKSDDSFYLPREAFDNPDFKRVIQLFLSPDGHAARFFITHDGYPATPDGMARVNLIKKAATESLKGTPLSTAKVYVAGTAALFNDLQGIADYDLLIAGITSLAIIFIIMLLITRSFIASLVIVGTVLASLGASVGLSVLVWQYIFGINLHWLVMVMSVIILLAVGCDYNLLLVARFKEEMSAGLKTGIIRAMGGTGKVVTAAGLVFAFTMASMLVSDLRVVGQVGTTIGLGLLFDTLIVRSFLMPSVAALLGRWFWWPLNVREHPARASRSAVPVAAAVGASGAVGAPEAVGEPEADAAAGQADAPDWIFEDMVATAFPEMSVGPAEPAADPSTEMLTVTQPPEDETEP